MSKPARRRYLLEAIRYHTNGDITEYTKSVPDWIKFEIPKELGLKLVKDHLEKKK